MKRFASALLFLLLAGCASAPAKPVPPPAHGIDTGALYVRIDPAMSGVEVSIDADGPGQTLRACPGTDERGITLCAPVPAGEHHIFFEHIPNVDDWIVVGDNPIPVTVTANANTDLVIRLKPVKPPAPAIPFRGQLRIVDRRFVDPQGQPWTWAFATEFLLLNDVLDGKDISPILDDLVTLGANGVRVIGMAHYIPLNERGARDFTPANYGDRYFEGLGELADQLRARGLYLEFTALADAQLLMPEPRDQRRFLEKVAGVLSSKPNSFLEHCNEPFKNGCGDELAMGRAPGAVLQASGNYDVRDAGDRYVMDAVFDYVTAHPDRGDEWARKAHDAQDLRDGFDDQGKHFDGVQRPVVLDEPIGAADIARGGSRASDPNLFREFGAASALFGAGATFHSDNGVGTKPFSDVQRAAAAAFFAGINAVDSRAQGWDYARGDQVNKAGVPFPIALYHDDAWALRTFVKRSGQTEFVVVVGRTPAWRYQEQQGYHCTPLVPEGDVLRCER